jgi:cobalt/nickel transport system permease protein
MHHAFIDEHSEIGSVIHQLDPRIKVVSFGLLILSVMLMDVISLHIFGLLLLMLAVLVLLSRVPPAFILKRSLVIVPFSVMIAAFLPFMKEGHVIWNLGWSGLPLKVTVEGLQLFMNIVAKSFISVISIILLTSTTRFPDLLKALEKLKCPQVMILILSFMYRYVFVVEDEFMKMRQAKLSRSVGKSWRREVKTLSNMIGVLFLRSYERAEAVYLAMCSRGFTGCIQYHHEFRLTAKDVVFLAVLTVSLAGIRYIDYLHV